MENWNTLFYQAHVSNVSDYIYLKKNKTFLFLLKLIRILNSSHSKQSDWVFGLEPSLLWSVGLPAWWHLYITYWYLKTLASGSCSDNFFEDFTTNGSLFYWIVPNFEYSPNVRIFASNISNIRIFEKA